VTSARPRTIRFTGDRVRLVLDLPQVELHEERDFRKPNQIAKIRRFFRQSIPKTEAALEDGRFVVSAEVTYWQQQGAKWVILGRWKAGESISAVLDDASVEFRRLIASRVNEDPKGG
jgi:hypothetical protein